MSTIKTIQLTEEAQRELAVQLLDMGHVGGLIGGYCEEGFPIYYVNKALVNMLGYATVDEFITAIDGMVANTIHPADMPRVMKDLGEEYYEGRTYRTVYRMPKKDGTWLWVLDKGRVISTAEGRLAVISYCTDITEHVLREQKAQRELKEANQKLVARMKNIQAMSGIYTSMYDIDMNTGLYVELSALDDVESHIPTTGDIRVTMPHFCEYMMLPECKEEMLAFVDLSTLDERMGNRKFISKVYLSTIPIPGYDETKGIWTEVTFIESERHPDGRLSHVMFTTKTVHDDVIRELEYQDGLREALQAAKDANEAKTVFLSNMSHDIRTPMNAIIGYSKLIKRELKTPKLLDYQEKIDASCNLLLSIIDHVLDMSHIESGKVEIKEAPISVETIPYQIANVFGPEAKRKDITMSYTVNVKHKTIMCDLTKISEIYTNIVSNAIKYTPAKGLITGVIDELPCEKEGYALYRTTITDTGIGMSEEFLPHLFDSFSREKNTTLGKVAGTGLGMSIVKKLVELLGGTIEVESELGKGSKFIVTLPHKLVDEQELKTDNSSNYAEDTLSIQGKRILLAEDNELNAELATILLEEIGLVVERVEDGAQCVAKLESEPAGSYDLILTDIQMPVMDGYEVARTIRQMADKAKANIPIIAMTANAFEEDRKYALKAGMNGHIAKPIDVTKILEELRRVLVK